MVRKDKLVKTSGNSDVIKWHPHSSHNFFYFISKARWLEYKINITLWFESWFNFWGCLSWFEWSKIWTTWENPDILKKSLLLRAYYFFLSFLPSLQRVWYLLLLRKILHSSNLRTLSFKSNNYHQQLSSSLIGNFIPLASWLA